jgi:hypothetical protein
MNKVVYILLLFFILFSIYQCDNNSRLKEKASSDNDMIEALTSDVKHYHNEAGKAVAEKQAIVADIDQVKKLNKKLLSENQKLLQQNLSKKENKKAVAAVQIKEVVKIRVDTVALTSDTLTLENEKFVAFKEDKKNVYVTITNSNPAFKTLDVDAVYEKQKPKWYNRKGFKIAVFIAGLATGLAL